MYYFTTLSSPEEQMTPFDFEPATLKNKKILNKLFCHEVIFY